MYIPEKGVLKNSNTYFHTPSSMAKTMFFYLKAAGHFFCTINYKVEREDYNSFLLMLVKKGNGEVFFDGKNYNAKENDVIFLDCHKPHKYFSNNWETLWIHFDGNMSKEYFNLLYERYGCVVSLKDSIIVHKYLNSILDSFENAKTPNEPLISCYIQRMLTELILISSELNNEDIDTTSPVNEAITYIKNNYKERLTLEDLASKVSLSPFYFSRRFKKETGYSPYEYIIMVRLNEAKRLLKSTNMSIKEIVFSTGFKSESNFVTCFKNNNNLTPSAFRNTHF